MIGKGKERYTLIVSISLVLLFLPFSGLAQAVSSLKFIENKNQWPHTVDYAARIPGGRLFLSPAQFSVYLLDQKKLEDGHLHKHGLVNESDGNVMYDDDAINGHLLQIDFLNANLSSQPQAFNRSKEYYNYFIGNDSSKWASNVYAYSELVYPSIYEGIDLKISSVHDNLKYDFVVKNFSCHAWSFSNYLRWQL